MPMHHLKGEGARPPRRIPIAFYAVLAAACPLTFVLHEGGHWLAGTLLGHAMRFSLNAVVTASGTSASTLDALMITGAGPLVTLLQGIVAFLLVRRRNALMAYAFLFAAWFMRFAAALVSIVNPNDEARMGLQLGLDAWMLPTAIVLVLLALTGLGARRLGVGWRTNVASYLDCSVLFAAIVFGSAVLAT